MIFSCRGFTLGNTTYIFFVVFGLGHRRSGWAGYIAGWRRRLIIPLGPWVVVAGLRYCSMTLRMLAGDDDG